MPADSLSADLFFDSATATIRNSMCATRFLANGNGAAETLLNRAHDLVIGAGFIIVMSYSVYQAALVFLAINRTAQEAYTVGEQISSIAGLRFDTPLTTIVVLHSACPHCTNSLPFYRSLLAARTRSVATVAAICLEPLKTCQQYLADGGLAMDAVIQNHPALGLKITATPSLLVLDRERRVLGAWTGYQNAAGQSAILAMLLDASGTDRTPNRQAN